MDREQMVEEVVVDVEQLEEQVDKFAVSIFDEIKDKEN